MSMNRRSEVRKSVKIGLGVVGALFVVGLFMPKDTSSTVVTPDPAASSEAAASTDPTPVTDWAPIEGDIVAIHGLTGKYGNASNLTGADWHDFSSQLGDLMGQFGADAYSIDNCPALDDFHNAMTAVEVDADEIGSDIDNNSTVKINDDVSALTSDLDTATAALGEIQKCKKA